MNSRVYQFRWGLLLVTDVLVNAAGASLVLVWVLVRPYLDLRAVSLFLPNTLAVLRQGVLY